MTYGVTMHMRFVSIVVLAFVTSACGGAETQPPTVASTPPVATTTPTTSAAATATTKIEEPAPPAKTPQSPFDSPNQLCWSSGPMCSVSKLDDATLDRLQTIANLGDYEIWIESSNDASLATVTNAKWVKKLVLANGKVTSLAPLASLSALKELTIQKTEVAPAGWSTLATLPIEKLAVDEVSGDVSGLSAMAGAPNLRALRLEQLDALSDLSFLSSMTSLRFLELDTLKAPKDWSPLGKLTSIEELSLLRDSIAKLPDPTAWTKLTVLHLEQNDALKDFSAVAKVPTIKTLHLGHSKVASLTAVAKLPALEDLGLEFTPLHTLAPLKTTKTLKHVMVTPDMPHFERDALKKAVPGVEIEEWGGGMVIKDALGGKKCHLYVPGCCLCDGAEQLEAPCPAKN
jgi:Leucine-rich repeat (LRR) protein